MHQPLNHYGFSDSAWAQAAARNRRRERREMLLALLYLVAIGAFFADVWLRAEDSLLGQFMTWAALLPRPWGFAVG